MIGFDTGIFLLLLSGDEKAVNLFRKIEEDDNPVVISCLSIFELKRHALRGLIKEKDFDKLINLIVDIFKIVWLDKIDLLTKSAKLSHGTSLHASDSMILNSLISSGCEVIYATDSHFEKYKKKGIKIINLGKKDEQE